MLSPHMRRRLRDARKAVDEAVQARDEAIEAAWRSGGTLREISTEVGMTHTGIGKMLERLGVRPRWRTFDDIRLEDERRGATGRGG